MRKDKLGIPILQDFAAGELMVSDFFCSEHFCYLAILIKFIWIWNVTFLILFIFVTLFAIA